MLNYLITPATPPGIGYLRFSNDFSDPSKPTVFNWIASISQGKPEVEPNDLLAWTSLSQMYMRDGQIPEAEAAKSNAAVLGIGGKIDKSK